MPASRQTDRRSWIERAAERLRLIPMLAPSAPASVPPADKARDPAGALERCPPPERWEDWQEWDAAAWPRRQARRYRLIPTTCFNCESACGLLAYVDKDSGAIRRFEGNPLHPASRGRTCAKGPATINQINDPERILHPLKRNGPRGSGQWTRVSWSEALDDIAARIRKALQEQRHNEVVYHVGRPGHEGYMDRVLQSWGVDGHNSHTNVCSAGARFGYAIWQGFDRPSPDYAHAEFILLLSAHLESGHYFNPHAQRIMEGKLAGAELAVMDPRLSNTASMADYWMPTFPGSEAAVLLAMARIILSEGLYNRAFLERWVNWRNYLAARHPDGPRTFERFIEALSAEYAEFTPLFAAQEAGIDAAQIVTVARRIGRAGTRFAAHNWRGAASGNLGGWQVARCLHFLSVLTGAVGTRGGTLPSAWNKFKPTLVNKPPAQTLWNALHYPREYPLAHYEMSPILPYLLKEGRGRMDVYFTRVFNPVWTYPDGFSWIEVLREERHVGLHIALTPTWNETAIFADYVLPMGLGPERHDLNSYETHAGTWIAFRQPVLRRFAEAEGRPVELTHQTNPGEVWEEDEFWIELSWRIDPDGSLGIRKHFLSPYREGEKLTIDEYYRYAFEHVPGLPEAAAAQGLNALTYMQRYGAFEVVRGDYAHHEQPLDEAALRGTQVHPDSGLITRDGAAVGVQVDGVARAGFPTPSRRQELYSATLAEWGWPEYALPGYIHSHVHPEALRADNAFVMVPTFRLPNLIHSRSGNAKWLVEIAHRNPIWMHTSDAARLGLATGDLLKVNTEIGHFIDRVWVTEAIKPGVLACSHHIGRWMPEGAVPGNRWAANTVRLHEEAPGRWRMNTVAGVRPFASADADSLRIFWRDGGVHQNITHAPHPDPISGMHCWHQAVRVEKPGPGEAYGDVVVDTQRAFAVYRAWLAKTRPPRRDDRLRRPLWLNRPLRPVTEAFYE
ncbi:MAG: molybdopterin-dependent oxidoreductase [Candidatus Lambdaproteobacteria bacterium]|nr:molybdopterin-dependent oxidoreductase [Candidatus Lambdaproteobacteria bacterium]